MNPADLIFVDSWEKLAADFAVAYCTTEFVREAFQKIRDDGRPTVLISGCCDYGVRLQEQHHPNADFPSCVNAVEWDKLAAERDSYPDIVLKSPCLREYCQPRDKYAIRMDRHTVFTFNDEDVPANLTRWFVNNLDISHPRMELLPFGLNPDGIGKTLLPGFVGRPKKGLLYVNFQNYTTERVNLKRFFRHSPWVTFREDANLPVDQFLAEVAEHKFVLSPNGNGLDCYRNYECMYLGSFPILSRSHFSETLLSWGLPIVLAENFYGLTEESLENTWGQIKGRPFHRERVSLGYWRKHLGAAV